MKRWIVSRRQFPICEDDDCTDRAGSPDIDRRFPSMPIHNMFNSRETCLSAISIWCLFKFSTTVTFFGMIIPFPLHCTPLSEPDRRLGAPSLHLTGCDVVGGISPAAVQRWPSHLPLTAKFSQNMPDSARVSASRWFAHLFLHLPDPSDRHAGHMSLPEHNKWSNLGEIRVN